MDKPYGEEKTQGPVPDFEELSRNTARFIEGAGKAAAAYLKPVQEGQPPAAGDVSEAVKSLGRVAEIWMSDPQKSFEAQPRNPVPVSLGLDLETCSGGAHGTGGRAGAKGQPLQGS
jgi:hypothetical protein